MASTTATVNAPKKAPYPFWLGGVCPPCASMALSLTILVRCCRNYRGIYNPVTTPDPSSGSTLPLMT